MKTSKKMRAVIYHRVSTVDQDEQGARTELEMAAKVRGFTIEMVIEETGSGARNDRPGLQRVMEAALRSRVDVVLVWKLDRFGRSSLDLLSNLRKLDDAGVRFIATSQGIDLQPGGDAMSKLLVTMLSAIAEFERDLIRERTILGLQKARRRGKRLGRPVDRSAPTQAAVKRLRASGASWSLVGAELGCTPSAARRAIARLVEKGGAKSDA